MNFGSRLVGWLSLATQDLRSPQVPQRQSNPPRHVRSEFLLLILLTSTRGSSGFVWEKGEDNFSGTILDRE